MFPPRPHRYLVLAVNAFRGLFVKAVTFCRPAHRWSPCARWARATSWGVTPISRGHKEGRHPRVRYRPMVLARLHSRPRL